jgi:2-keto-3-deoxy-L-rhamnonate aldolase RhmA
MLSATHPEQVCLNRVNDVTRRGEVALGVAIRLIHKVDVGKIMRTCGFDFLFLDMEHTPISSEVIAQICVAAQDAGIAPIVRVPSIRDRSTTVQVLDGGAQGIVFPHIDTAEEAREAVSICRYPPRGRRSVAYGLPQANYQSMPAARLVHEMEQASLLGVMLETPKAIEEAEEIAAVEGVDVLHVGMQDLSMEHGIPGELGHPILMSALEKVARVCREHGKVLGLGGCYDPDLLERYLPLGVRFAVVTADLSTLMAGASAQAARVRGMTLSQIASIVK